MPIIVRKLLGRSEKLRPGRIQPSIQHNSKLLGGSDTTSHRLSLTQVQRRRQPINDTERPAQSEHRELVGETSSLARTEWRGLAADHDSKRSKLRTLQVLKESPLSPERTPDVIRQWRRIAGLRASIAAGVKPVDIHTSDGRQIHVYSSSRRHVNFLANGPRRSFDDIRCRLEEGEALALKVDVDQLRLSYSDQTAVKSHYSASERSTAIRARWWINDISNRVEELEKTAYENPIKTPLGNLAQAWFEPISKPAIKLPARTKRISLALWPQDDGKQKNVPLLGNQTPPGKSGTETALDKTSVSSVSEDHRIANWSPVTATTLSEYEPPMTRVENYWASWTVRFEQMCRGEGLNLRVLDQSTVGSLVQTYGFTPKPVDLLNKARTVTYPQNVSQTEMWGDIMLWCLHNSQYGALRLLNATIMNGKENLPQYVVNNCMTYLAQHFLGASKAPDKSIMQELYGTFEIIMNTDVKECAPGVIDDHVIHLMLQHSTDDQARSLLELCMKSKVRLHANTLLHLLERSAKMGYLSLSVQILQGIANSGIDLSSDKVQSACVKMIRTRVNNDSEYQVQTKLVTQLLEMKFVPKVALYNAMILNAGDAGDFDTAWRLYQVGKENGLASSSITYGVLFKSAKLCGDSDAIRDSTEKVLDEVLKDRPAMQDLRLLQDVLTAISLHWKGKQKFPLIFKRMLGLYKKYCNLAPLKDLHICGPSEAQSSSIKNLKVQWPTPGIVGQLIASFAHAHCGKESLINVFNQYRSMFLEKHPLVTEVAQSDFVANAFTTAFGRRSETLHHCIAVLKHMLEDSTVQQLHSESDARFDGAYQPIGKSSRLGNASNAELPLVEMTTIVRRPCRPTAHTWYILLSAYMNHGHKRAAERIIELMEERGVRPNRTTWEKLISGYARMQDVKATVDTIGRMQAAGYDVDAGIAAHLARLWDRKRLIEALKSIDKPANSGIGTVPSVKKPIAEVITEIEKVGKDVDKRKQKEAKLYLAGLPSQLHSENQAADPRHTWSNIARLGSKNETDLHLKSMMNLRKGALMEQ